LSIPTNKRFDIQPQYVAGSIEELLQGEEVASEINAGDSRSGATLERVSIGGEKFVLKRISRAQDWLMRTSGDDDGWTVNAWESGIMSHVPDSIDHTTVSAARWDGPDGIESAVLMRDVGNSVVEDGDSVIPLATHKDFIKHMAELHATFLGFDDVGGLMPLQNRYLFLSPAAAKAELEYDPTSQIPKFVLDGWKQLVDKAPDLAKVVLPLHDDLSPLLNALSNTPFTFMHGDWKMTNLGSADGRTILLDWAFPGFGPGCSELAWYLAINAARNPQSKEDTIEWYRVSLERLGVDTSAWWDRQMGLAMIGVMTQFGWEKALGGGDELDWWVSETRSLRDWE
jgi:hypothetical protein